MRSGGKHVADKCPSLFQAGPDSDTFPFREVITIQKFLEAAVRQETSGKVRIQQFIENLLTRIALAERLVEYYQVNGSPVQCSHHKVRQ